MKNVDKNKIRKEIDSLDLKILELLNKRAGFALEIGRLKRKLGDKIYIPDREKIVMTRILENNKGPLTRESTQNIFNEILHSARALQASLKIAYFGPEATFTHLAAVKNFGRYSEFISCKSIGDVFQAVEKNRADYGVVPIENTTEGIVNHTLDIFYESDLLICSEINLRIEQCLLANAENLKSIKKVFTHYQPLAQCRKWLEFNLMKVEIVEVSSTAEAAKLAAKTKNSAAIGSYLAGDVYKLKVMARGIEDSKENFTRFLVIGRQITNRSGYDKTSIMFSIKDKIGALHSMLAPFQKYGINLTKIESRPTKKKAWEYVFFIDLAGHIEDKKVRLALQELNKQCVFLKILGSYPKAE
ncbi:MAG: chorismate mutase [Elusimicrobia bacterium RIFOXYA2_FULL_39_19]|nr:MAG: chorismate mutase [Elusimicrobia bacterium RIFOXYA2_FULL_39_19]